MFQFYFLFLGDVPQAAAGAAAGGGELGYIFDF